MLPALFRREHEFRSRDRSPESSSLSAKEIDESDPLLQGVCRVDTLSCSGKPGKTGSESFVRIDVGELETKDDPIESNEERRGPPKYG